MISNQTAIELYEKARRCEEHAADALMDRDHGAEAYWLEKANEYSFKAALAEKRGKGE